MRFFSWYQAVIGKQELAAAAALGGFFPACVSRHLSPTLVAFESLPYFVRLPEGSELVLILLQNMRKS